MWRHQAAAAGIPFTFHTTESFSTPTPPHLPTPPDLVVVDEAHHFRTPTTRRYARLATVCSRARVLLLSATPVHNATRDLTTLLALFLGEHAATLPPATLAHLVVRRRHRDLRAPGHSTPSAAPELPAVAHHPWSYLPAASAVLESLLALPPPIPASDGGHAPALATLTLVRLWASSDAALRAALRRRLARAAALAHALAAGYHLDRHALAAWTAHDDALQLPLFLDGPASSVAPTLARHVDAHAAALRHTLATLDAAPATDPARVDWLQAVRARHPNARVVAFTQFADTARAVFRAIAPAGHAGLLTASGGRIASGPLARDALLARFAPRSTGAHHPSAIERVDCLIATDCLSEGLDLRGASVVVHLDVPWTPARLAQRVGRAARLGAPHAAVHVYGLRPDLPVARWLRVARRLRAKARAARHALGSHPVSERGRTDRPPRGRALRVARHMAAHRQLERWLAGAVPLPLPTVAAVRCGRSGFVAVCHPGHRASPRVVPPTILAVLDGRAPTAAPGTVVRALRHLARPGATPVAPPPGAVAAARAAIHGWTTRRAALDAVGAGAPPAFAPAGRSRHPSVRATLAHADAALRTAPPHARLRRAHVVTVLREALARPVSAGTECALAALPAPTDHDGWLAAALAVVTANGRGPADTHDQATSGSVARARPDGPTALVLLLP
jgi:hypothetical protein